MPPTLAFWAAVPVLGHSTIGLTSDTYTSVILGLHRPNASAAADLIPPEGG
jgi:hypothetical protein